MNIDTRIQSQTQYNSQLTTLSTHKKESEINIEKKAKNKKKITNNKIQEEKNNLEKKEKYFYSIIKKNNSKNL